MEGIANVETVLQGFYLDQKITYKMYVCPNLSYDIIMNRDILHNLGMTLNFKSQLMIQDHAEVPMKEMQGDQNSPNFHVQEEHLSTAIDKIKKILNA